VEMSNRNTAKALAAVIGGGALVAMGILATDVGEAPVKAPAAAMGPMTAGATMTYAEPVPAVPGTPLATSKAVPPVKAQAYK
jgi:hypothetical protein